MIANKILCGGLILTLAACGGGTSQLDYVPTAEPVVDLQNDFLDDVAQADVAARIVKACDQFEYNQNEDDVVVEKFAARAALLSTKRGVSDAEASAFQNAAPQILQSKQSKSYVKDKVREILADKGVSRSNPGVICEVGETEYSNRSQIGRFLKRS